MPTVLLLLLLLPLLVMPLNCRTRSQASSSRRDVSVRWDGVEIARERREMMRYKARATDNLAARSRCR